MHKNDLATKQDLDKLDIRISGVESNLQSQIVGLRSDMKYEMATLRVDMRNDMKIMFDDVLGVLGDMLAHIDTRFNKLEKVIGKHDRAIKRLENSRH